MIYQTLNEFLRLPGSSQGYTLKEMLEAEGKLGRLLPGSLRVYYQFFGKSPLLTQAFHKLIAAKHLYEVNGYSLFHRENQGVWQAGIFLEALSPADPPVSLND